MAYLHRQGLGFEKLFMPYPKPCFMWAGSVAETGLVLLSRQRGADG